MADTAICYNENEKCDDCGKSPVQFHHWGKLTDGEYKRLCKECFQKRGTKVNKNV